MVVCFAIDDNSGLKSMISPHFGKCAYYLFANIKEGNVEDFYIISNPYKDNHEPGVVPKFIHKEGADIMVSGGMGPKAQGFFNQFGIKVITGLSGKVDENIHKVMNNHL